MLLSDRLTFLGNKKQLKMHATGTMCAGKCMQLAIRRERNVANAKDREKACKWHHAREKKHATDDKRGKRYATSPKARENACN